MKKCGIPKSGKQFNLEMLKHSNFTELEEISHNIFMEAVRKTERKLVFLYYTTHLASGLGNTVSMEGGASTSEDIDLFGYKVREGKLIPLATAGVGISLLKKI